MGASNLFRRLSVQVACSVVGAAALVLPAGAAPGGNTNASVNLDQCRNGGTGSAPQDCDADGWDNGNLNPNQAHYTEGQSAPYRLVMEGLPLGESITVVLEYDVMHSGKHAIDFLTHYDRIAEAVVPTDGVTGVSDTVGTYPIPAPSSVGSPVPGQPTDAFNALPAAERVMTLFGGEIDGMAYVSEGDLSSTGNSAAQVSVTFVADSATAVLAWGGHIASPENWGAGNSASGVSGSPYHMSVVDWTLGNLGNQDRSMQADVVLPSEPEAPAQLTVTKVIDNGDGGTGVVGDFDLLVDGVERPWGTPISLPAGTYTVSEGPHDGYVSTITGACAANGAITLTAGQVAQCTITNDDIASPPPAKATLVVTKLVVNDDAGTDEVSDFDLFIGTTQVVSGAANELDPGTYTVSEGAHGGYIGTIGGACAANGAITLTAGQVAECIITNDDVEANPAPGPDPADDPDDAGTPGTNPGTNPTNDTQVESATQTNNTPALPVQTAVPALPTTGTTGSPETPVPTLAAELPRTGAGIREQSQLALALLAAGLLSLAIGRRRTRPSDV